MIGKTQKSETINKEEKIARCYLAILLKTNFFNENGLVNFII